MKLIKTKNKMDMNNPEIKNYPPSPEATSCNSGRITKLTLPYT